MAYNSRKGSVKNILDRLFSDAFGGIAAEGGAASFGVIGHASVSATPRAGKGAKQPPGASPRGLCFWTTLSRYGAMTQRCATPAKLIVGGEPQTAPPNAAGPVMVAG